MPAMRIAILQNNTDDGPAYLATWLRQRNIAFDVFDFERGDEAPASLADYAGLAILGVTWGTQAIAAPVVVKSDWRQIKPPPLRVVPSPAPRPRATAH